MVNSPLIILAFAIMFGVVFSKIHYKTMIAIEKASEYRTILDSYNNIVLIVDNKKVISANNKCLKFFGIKDNICETELHSRLMDSSISYILNYMVDHNIEVVSIDGVKTTFSVHPKKLSDPSENKYMIELVDITKHINEKNRLEDKAFTDQLTKVYNRRFFDEYLTKKFKNSRKTDIMSFILLDIDNFKEINDTYGHGIGDNVLVFLTTLIKNTIRSTDILCRWGGEEFLLITRTDKITASKIAENLRKLIDSSSTGHDTIPHFTCSFGVAETQTNKQLIETVEEADKLLYMSKRNGKNTISI